MSDGVVTIAEVLAAARAGRASLAPETAGYLALGVADALARDPQIVDERGCALGDDGAIAVAPGGPSAPAAEVEQSIRRLLARLLDAAGGSAPALVTAARKPGASDVPALVREIEAALIPVNRGAARRALARLARETVRARAEGLQVEPPDEGDTEPLTIPIRIDDSPPPPTPPEPTPEPAPPTPTEAIPPVATSGIPPVVEAAVTPPPPEPVAPVASGEPEPAAPVAPPPTRTDELLASFSANVARSDTDIARDLKALAGLDPTPPPAAVVQRPLIPAPPASPAPPPVSPSTPASVADADPPADIVGPPVSQVAKGSGCLLAGLLLLGIAAMAAVWTYYPGFFTGHRP